ncbi:SNF2 helicase associated domain-containing protein [Cohnella hongkongensis]|uniref:SNF2 helicase associated domain-containing protein n=1 Tax=Cohnella hongkongensis TaxID=178337 RepID=A0ABV9FB75_9BACL
MSFQLTKRIIKTMCGSYSYERGEADCRAGKVAISDYDPALRVCAATVKGTHSLFRVEIRAGDNGDLQADCECLRLNLSASSSCRHIAAVLLSLYELQRSVHPNAAQPAKPASARLRSDSRAAVSPEAALSDGLLDLFDNKPPRPRRVPTLFDSREPLNVEFIVSLFPYGYRKNMFAIELRAGVKRTYVVPKLRDFLESVDRRERCEFSRHFTYDPAAHCFHESNDAILRKLIEIHYNEKMYRESAGVHAAWSIPSGGERMLLIPSAPWTELAPLLAQAASVRLEHDGMSYEGLRLSDMPIPLLFDLDQAPDPHPIKAGTESESQPAGYRLDVSGLDRLTVLEPYGLVLSEGALLKLNPEQCRRLFELQRMLANARDARTIRIPPERIAPFMEKVVPGLMRIGSVRLSKTVSDQVVQAPLKAKLYLDRVRDRLLAGLEFHYGGVVINPLEDPERSRGTSLILMREGDKEAQILDLMEQANFMKTESGYMMEDEEGQYDFLYHVIPQLEKLLQVYATTAVKIRLHSGRAPRIRVDVDERTDWLACKFELDGVPETEIRHLIQALSEKRRYYRLPSGALMPLETPDYEAINRFIAVMKVDKGSLHGSEFRLPAVRGLHLIDAENRDPALKLGKSLRSLLENMRNPDSLDFPVPDTLAPILRDYQKFGYQWLRTLAHYRFGGILADDMGLGKTLQSIAYLVSALSEIRSHGQPAIIVCPASLSYNWLNELRRFAPEVRAVVADGDKSERGRILSELSQVDVLITSYPLLRRDAEAYAQPYFHTLILDEAQAVKNYATQTAHSVKALQARHRFALTGTPIENALEELWSICDVVFPELFQDRRTFSELSREAVARRIRPFLLRRLKTDVLSELPEKIESVQSSVLLPEQKKLYLSYLAKLRKETLKHLDEEGFGRSRIRILAGLTRLRQLCCHPGLFVEGYEGGSAKFDQLMELIEECRGAGKRMLVFSQFTEMLSLISRELGYRGVSFFYLDGATPPAERVDLCSRFNDGERELFLISLKAGGTGLNLTGADTVILYDLWWNPAVEQQAADRAHRMGQKNVVQVIRLLAQDTVEEKMYALQQRKKHLVDEVIEPGQEALSTMTEEEIRELLTI